MQWGGWILGQGIEGLPDSSPLKREIRMKAHGLRSIAGERKWQLQEAKNRLSRLVEQATEEGPQTITLRGKPAAVVLSVNDFEKLTRPSQSLCEFFRRSPLQGVDLDLKRSKESARKVDL